MHFVFSKETFANLTISRNPSLDIFVCGFFCIIFFLPSEPKARSSRDVKRFPTSWQNSLCPTLGPRVTRSSFSLRTLSRANLSRASLSLLLTAHPRCFLAFPDVVVVLPVLLLDLLIILLDPRSP